MSVPVLVCDGEQRSALACVRSLGRSGHRPFVASANPRPLAGASRFAAGAATTADPTEAPRAFVQDLQECIRKWNIEIVLPMTDASCLAVLAHREQLGKVCVPLPPEASFRAVSDKESILEAARAVGIRVPAHRTIRHAGEAADEAPDEVGFPLVLKPARSVAEDSSGRLYKLGVSYASSARELTEKLATLPPAAFPVLLQERVSGPGIGVFLLIWDGRTLARFVHRRIREKPPSGGVSVYRESFAADPALIARSEALLAHYEWRGVAMVEYKIDATTGEPVLMEVNGRFWGSLQLAIDAGVDFPTLLLEAIRGQPFEAVTGYRIPVRSRWLWGDVDQLLTRLRRSKRSLDLPEHAPGRLSALLQFLRWRPGDRTEVLRLSDMRPFVRETRERMRPT